MTAVVQQPTPDQADTAEEQPTGGATTVVQELAAMRRIARDLDTLDPDARGRAMRWLTGRYPGEG